MISNTLIVFLALLFSVTLVLSCFKVFNCGVMDTIRRGIRNCNSICTSEESRAIRDDCSVLLDDLSYDENESFVISGKLEFKNPENFKLASEFRNVYNDESQTKYFEEHELKNLSDFGGSAEDFGTDTKRVGCFVSNNTLVEELDTKLTNCNKDQWKKNKKEDEIRILQRINDINENLLLIEESLKTVNITQYNEFGNARMLESEKIRSDALKQRSAISECRNIFLNKVPEWVEEKFEHFLARINCILEKTNY